MWSLIFLRIIDYKSKKVPYDEFSNAFICIIKLLDRMDFINLKLDNIPTMQFCTGIPINTHISPN